MNVNDAVMAIVFAAGVVVLFLKHSEIEKAIEAFKNHFPGGGPPTPP